MLNLKELQELRQINTERKVLTSRYGIKSINSQRIAEAQKLSAWDSINNKPQTLIINDGSDPILLDYYVNNKDITKNIVFHNRSIQSQQVTPRQQQIISQQYFDNTPIQLTQNIMHEYHHQNITYKLKSVDESLRQWKAKEIMLNRELQKLQLLIQHSGFIKKNQNKIQVTNIPKKLQLEADIQKLEAILKNKDSEITRLKILSQDLEQKEENIEIENNVQFSQKQQQLEDIKNKFKELNNTFHECQEQCLMLETEIESIKKRKVQVIKKQTIKINQPNKDSPRAVQSTVSDRDSDYI